MVRETRAGVGAEEQEQRSRSTGKGRSRKWQEREAGAGEEEVFSEMQRREARKRKRVGMEHGEQAILHSPSRFPPQTCRRSPRGEERWTAGGCSLLLVRVDACPAPDRGSADDPAVNTWIVHLQDRDRKHSVHQLPRHVTGASRRTGILPLSLVVKCQGNAEVEERINDLLLEFLAPWERRPGTHTSRAQEHGQASQRVDVPVAARQVVEDAGADDPVPRPSDAQHGASPRGGLVELHEDPVACGDPARVLQVHHIGHSCDSLDADVPRPEAAGQDARCPLVGAEGVGEGDGVVAGGGEVLDLSCRSHSNLQLVHSWGCGPGRVRDGYAQDPSAQPAAVNTLPDVLVKRTRTEGRGVSWVRAGAGRIAEGHILGELNVEHVSIPVDSVACRPCAALVEAGGEGGDENVGLPKVPRQRRRELV
eukprot:762469-Hanusia_phi.AAC.4